MTHTVEQLRKQGYKVRVKHFRRHHFEIKVGGQKQVVDPRGGRTVVEITSPSGLNAVGESFCCPIDNFDRKLGLKIALGRAIKNYCKF